MLSRPDADLCHVYVQSLNEEEIGPLNMEEAVKILQRRVYAKGVAIDTMLKDYRKGCLGPWNFTHGFHSVTVRTL